MCHRQGKENMSNILEEQIKQGFHQKIMVDSNFYLPNEDK